MAHETGSDLAEQIAAYPEDPIGFAEDVLNVSLDTWQCRFLEAVRDHSKVAVRSSTGQGKDFTGAIAILWFLSQFWKAYCPCTANSQDQVEKILWKQFSELLTGSNGLLEIFEWTATTIKHREFPAEWLAFAKTSAKKVSGGGERHAEGSAGHHADNMLILLDEASGIEEEFWQAYEPTLTGPNNKIIAIGNPNRLSGSFYQIWHKARVAGFWQRFTIAGRTSPKAVADGNFFVSHRGNQSGNHDYLIAKWGANHPIVQSKVFGVHPTVAGGQVGFSWDEVMAARNRSIEPGEHDAVQIGIDASGGGKDRTVYFVRRGRRFRFIVERPQSTHHIVDKILEIADSEPDATAERYDFQPLVVPDDGGLIDLSGWLKKAGYKNVRGVHFGGSPRNKKLYHNLAAEMWLDDLKRFFLCETCSRPFEAHFDDPVNHAHQGDARCFICEPCTAYLPGIDLPGDDAGEDADELLSQLITREWFFTGKERIQRAIQPKDEIRKDTGKSPDHADALCLSVVRPRVLRVL